jgi:hypothetical protein
MIDNPFTMVVCILAIVMTSVVLMVRYKTQAHRSPPLDDGRTARLHEDVARLKERVAVLERIATDRNHMLEQEFDALRDRPLPARDYDALHG